MDRRAFLSTFGLVLGGCTGADDSVSSSPTPTEMSTATPTSTTTATATPTATVTPIHADYETTEVVVQSPEGERLGVVTAAIADTSELRYLGLSDTEYLPEDRGMLFVFDSVSDRTFVMRDMDFGIDIIYADSQKYITKIHHAPAPAPDEDGSEQRYPGRGQYVLEVTYKWTTEHSVTVGDKLQF